MKCRVHRKTGILVFGSRDDRRVKKYKDSLNANSISYRTLTGTEASWGGAQAIPLVASSGWGITIWVGFFQMVGHHPGFDRIFR